ncbi:amidohydrolase [Nonomuraea salmonea]|uniref:amidohydrolase n=1 Tax=Nonomuraea salmonea TaxID=46181 RepID=UPI0031E5FA24
MRGRELRGELDAFLAETEQDLVAFRRDLHMHPELAFAEYRTTQRIAERLTAAGLSPSVLPKGTGLICDVGSGDGPTIALRADIDALPLQDEKDVPYRSTVAGACHACGHDVHTTVLLGTSLFLAQQAAAGSLPGRVRLIFQPAEELPGGALEVMAHGGISGVDRIFGLHCDPRVDVGQFGLRTGPITSACDKIAVRVSGPGGHTARPPPDRRPRLRAGQDPHRAARRAVAPRRPALLAQPRLGQGGGRHRGQRHPRRRGRRGHRALPRRRRLARRARPHQVAARVRRRRLRRRGHPRLHPRGAARRQRRAQRRDAVRRRRAGPRGRGRRPHPAVTRGGEDFGWYLESIPGAFARLGTRSPDGVTYDIHQGTFDVDEKAIAMGGCG